MIKYIFDISENYNSILAPKINYGFAPAYTNAIAKIISNTNHFKRFCNWQASTDIQRGQQLHIPIKNNEP